MHQNSEFLTETPGSDPHISQLHSNSVMESQLLDDFLLNGSPIYQDDSMAHINIDEAANFQNFIKTDEADDSPNLLSFDEIGNNTHSNENVSTPLEDEMEGSRGLKKEEENEHGNKLFKENNMGSPAHDEIVFGRKETIHSVYINPLDYLKVNAAQLTLQVEVSGLPQVSRVENQLKLKVKVTSETPLSQNMVYLPSDSISREKFYLKKNIDEFSEEFRKNLLYINAFVLCAVSNRTTNVCTKCVKREQRRAARRKSGIADNLLWCNNINRRLVVFNNKQVFPIMKTFDNVKEFELTTRLVCYCRHHKANNGFVILFTITDWQNRLLGKYTTTPIMITDRKPANMDTNKFNNTTTSSRRQLTEEESTTEYYSTDNNQLSKDENMPFQYTYQHNPYDNGSQVSNIPFKDKNAPFQYSISQQTDLLQNNNLSLNLSLPNQHIPSPTSMSEEGSESFNYHRDNDNPVRTISLTNIEQQSQLNQRKRARNNLENDIGKPLFKHSFSNSISSVGNTINPSLHAMQDFAMKNNNTNNNNSLPSINRVIPSQGPINGGIEVTLLGCNFKDGLSVKFGANLALSTQCWSETTIVTYLPPAAYAGQVFVSITDTNSENNADDLPQEIEINDNKKAIFTYVDDTDRQLIELALQIVGLKMNGKLEDARNIAKRIVGNDSPDSGTNGSTGPSPNQHNVNMNTNVFYSDEVLIQKVIKSLNINSNISICDSLGRTLLHLACLKNYSSLVYTLIKKGARVNDIDSFGLTPLHFACISGDPKIIKMLLNCKVNYLLKSHNGLTAKEIFIANHVQAKDINKKQENRDNHNFVHNNNAYVNEVLSLFEVFQDGTKFTDNAETDSNYSISRKYSQSSFNSSLLDNESLNENLFENQSLVIPARMEIQHPTLQLFDNSSYSEYDQSDFEEDGDEDLFVTDELEQPGVESREKKSESLNTGPNTNVAGEDNGSTSLWNRVLHRINDDLPKYEDLFPLSWGKDDKSEAVNQDNIMEQSSNIENSENSEEDEYEEEEEFLKKQFNRFFQNKQNFQNDKMLIFFWIPLTLLLLTWFIMYKFGNQDNSINHISELISEYLRIALAKFLLGNERMKTAFKSKLSNLQTTRMLNDLIVS
ncbi:hypothetical protein SMKI_09G2000 [Saccharomyces mikatae IFO 1815]|uniref:IPT/TIG domain-containing protein n=1 Tax=Saccharomyces mikatae IFO 1815 TaxID=226126 RepID=A0AA35J254_SACMI|nr:uncharacterized protein SMKI_09G2000 [Saccharomyces mikatae IFO 1815]CAI4039788.1 hypothetical protein SMKI_09G2000 [Saccharomyces mikatae IFO 1815]